MAYKISVDGIKTELPDTKLETLQQAVDGYIEVIYLNDKVMVVNEEGKLLGLPVNQKATDIWIENYGPTDIIMGNIVIAEQNELESSL